MKAIVLTLQIFFLVYLFSQAGCEQTSVDTSMQTEPTPQTESDSSASIFASYSPVKIDIMPLTEFVSLNKADEKSDINVYVSLLDSFGSQKKSPGTFRFEIYEYVQRSAEPRGRRIAIWPDIDLTKAAENNKYWRDFLRAYLFNLPFEPAVNQSYILQITFLCPTDKRLSDECILKYTE